MNLPTITNTSISATPKELAQEKSPSRIPVRALGQDDFLKLLVAQMTHQDPLSPQKDTEFIAQMSSFTTLEQSKMMQADIASLKAQQTVQQSISLLNREVVIKLDDDSTLSGVVTDVVMQDGLPKIMIGDKSFDLGDIVNIRTPEQL